MSELFSKFAIKVSDWIGSIWAFVFFTGLILITGIYFNFSGEWQNNVTFYLSIITLSTLFFLQKSQNHNDVATHLKLDELIKASESARNEVASIEYQSDRDIKDLKEQG